MTERPEGISHTNISWHSRTPHIYLWVCNRGVFPFMRETILHLCMFITQFNKRDVQQLYVCLHFHFISLGVQHQDVMAVVM